MIESSEKVAKFFEFSSIKMADDVCEMESDSPRPVTRIKRDESAMERDSSDDSETVDAANAPVSQHVAGIQDGEAAMACRKLEELMSPVKPGSVTQQPQLFKSEIHIDVESMDITVNESDSSERSQKESSRDIENVTSMAESAIVIDSDLSQTDLAGGKLKIFDMYGMDKEPESDSPIHSQEELEDVMEIIQGDLLSVAGGTQTVTHGTSSSQQIGHSSSPNASVTVSALNVIQPNRTDFSGDETDENNNEEIDVNKMTSRMSTNSPTMSKVDQKATVSSLEDNVYQCELPEYRDVQQNPAFVTNLGIKDLQAKSSEPLLIMPGAVVTGINPIKPVVADITKSESSKTTELGDLTGPLLRSLEPEELCWYGLPGLAPDVEECDGPGQNQHGRSMMHLCVKYRKATGLDCPTREKMDVMCFSGDDSPLSPRYRRKVVIFSRDFITADHFMVYMKARVFNSAAVMEKVFKTPDAN